MYRYIFFDLDGTLTDSKAGILNCARYALETLGKPVPSDETLLKFVGPPLQESFQTYCGFTGDLLREAIDLFRARYASQGQYENQAAPGMAELLARRPPKWSPCAFPSASVSALRRPWQQWWAARLPMTAARPLSSAGPWAAWG